MNTANSTQCNSDNTSIYSSDTSAVNKIPLSLYVHIPWCVRKCPYCDFNSHKADSELPETEYVDALLADLDYDLPLVAGRQLTSIFIGGGTPSLFSGDAITRLMRGIEQRIEFAENIEITMEANPGASEASRFAEYRTAGINRLSIGVQSFDDQKLKALGRIHDNAAAIKAYESARMAGFDNINIDIMHGLPKQSFNEAMQDLRTAIDLQPNHISWYQLTLEPNTVFYKHPPSLPDDDALFEIEQTGFALLAENGYEQYEVSAFARNKQYSRHNLNYWQFGDYLGIGAGAHAKISSVKKNEILRLQKIRMPNSYLQAAGNNDNPYVAKQQLILNDDRVFEFMLNTLRLKRIISFELFEATTMLPRSVLAMSLDKLQKQDLLIVDDTGFALTELGHRYLNNVVAEFMTEG